VSADVEASKNTAEATRREGERVRMVADSNQPATTMQGENGKRVNGARDERRGAVNQAP